MKYKDITLNEEKKKIVFYALMIILVLIFVTIGVSYAFFDSDLLTGSISGEAACYTVNYTKGQDISGDLNMGSDYTTGKSTDVVMYSEADCGTMLGTLYITTRSESDMDLSDQALKYTVVVNETVVAEGSVNGTKNQIIYQDFTLNTTATTYKVYIWLDESMENMVDLTTENYSGFIHARAVMGEVPEVIDPRIDESGANYPELTDGLIPVMYDTTTSKWVTADVTSSTSTYGWYDYDAKKWANAVLVNDTKRESLTKDASGNYTPGQAIGDTEAEGVLAFYVWIPRYKYKVWNINKVIGTDDYGAQTKGIDIVFEEGTDTTGTISCTYDFSITATASVRNESCSGANGQYYTHPAFTFGNDELTGFWMGKFELSSSSPTSSNGGGLTSSLTPRILPNVASWRYNYLDIFWEAIKNMQVSDDYGITTDTRVVDTHMLTNMEWGAVAYLTYSQYGRCTGGESSTCTEVTINNHSNYITGNAGNSVSASSASSTSYTNTYATTAGQLASTTGNIYGVYDMSGGLREYVMGNVSLNAGTYAYNRDDAGVAFSYDDSTTKYLTTYAYGTGGADQVSNNRGRLGDATGEVRNIANTTGGWYSDESAFIYSNWPWLARGGRYDGGVNAGIFGFESNTGTYSSTYGTRASLAVFPTD